MSIDTSVNVAASSETVGLEQPSKAVVKRAESVSSSPKNYPSADEIKKSSADEAVRQSARVERVEGKSLEVAEQSFSVERIREMIRELEKALPAASNSLSFKVDEVLERPVITVVDKNSGEVVRTLPSEEVLRVAHNIEKMRGILFDGPA